MSEEARVLSLGLRLLVSFGMLVSIASSGHAAEAGKTHLTCTLRGLAHNPFTVELEIDEATKTGSVAVRDNGSRTTGLVADFAASTVTLRPARPAETSLEYVIDRTTLSIVQAGYLRGEKMVEQRGTCQLANIENRKF